MVFSKALEIINENPCALVTQSRVRYSVKKRTSHLELNEGLPKFLKTLTEYTFQRDSEKVARDIIVLILSTGLRVNEARTMTWNNVDIARKRFTIKDTKNHRDHIVPMTPLTYAMFKYRKENSLGSNFVFRVKSKGVKKQHMMNFQKTLNNICTQAETNRVTPHDLRRTFATSLNSLDVGYADLKFLMNHKDKDVTTGVYIQPNIERLRRHLFKVERFYDQKVPFFEAHQGCSQYTTGVLKFSLYKHGEPPTPEPLDSPTDENPEWEAYAENNFWEG